MAEQEPTAEQLAQIAAENEEDEHSVNYKPPAQKSIQEIQELDKDDESLRKYNEIIFTGETFFPLILLQRKFDLLIRVFLSVSLLFFLLL